MCVLPNETFDGVGGFEAESAFSFRQHFSHSGRKAILICKIKNQVHAVAVGPSCRAIGRKQPSRSFRLMYLQTR